MLPDSCAGEHRTTRCCRARRNEYMRDHNRRNRERVNEGQRRRRIAGGETKRLAHNAAQRRYNETPGRRTYKRVYAEKRRARLPMLDRGWALVIDTDPCAYCNKPGNSIDHITPVIKGGLGDWQNLSSACVSCNASKKDTTLLFFLLKRLNHAT